MVPTAVIIILFLAAFMLAVWQYQQIDPVRRILNLRFGLMAGAAVASFGYPILIHEHPGDRSISWLFLALAVAWLTTSWWLLRRMPPRDAG